MSRTYRKSRHTDGESFKSYLAGEIHWWKRNPTRTQRIKRTEAEMVEANRIADEEYEKRVTELAKERGISRELAKLYRGICRWTGIRSGRPTLSRWYVGNYRFVRIPISYDELVNKTKIDYAKFNRDGSRWHDHGKRAYWRELTNKAVRRETKKLVHSHMRGEEWDKPYPGDYLGKKYIWSVW
ncbi:MAG: hypothetical protein COA84_13660 [Robiginitomaculum sp.]|nr:MAG: hypothetical protein COA84_13660 [Robiginitomaculum sp.]